MDYEEQHQVPGSIPEFGAIFMSNNETKRECLRQKVFGLPSSQAYFVEHVKAGMALFIFEFERRELHGVFQACSDGAMNIVPHAFSSIGKQFPAQVKFFPLWNCSPLSEKEFRGAIRENYFSPRKFKFGLSEDQVNRLLYLFSKKKLEGQGPPRQLSGSRSLRASGYGMHRVRRVATSNRSLRSGQVTSGHKTVRNLDQTFPTMFPADNYSNYGRSMGAYNRSKQSVGVGNIDERDFGCSLATNLDFGYEHKEDSPFAPAFPDTCFEDSLVNVGVSIDASRLATASGRPDKEWNVGTDVKPSSSAEYPSNNFRRAPEDFSLKQNDWFEGEDYEDKTSVLPHSRESPSFSHWKLNQSPVSSKYTLEANLFKHDPAVPPSTFLHAAEPLCSTLSQQTLYRDAVVTTTLPYDPDVPYPDNHNSSSFGILQCSDSFPVSDNNPASLAVPTRNQFVPSYSRPSMSTFGGIGSSDCIPELCGKRHDSKNSSPEPCKFKVTELRDEGYGNFSYMEPSLPCSFSEHRNDMRTSEKLPLYSAHHKVLSPSVTSGCYSAAFQNTCNQNLPLHGRNVEFEADSLFKKHQASFVEPKSLDCDRYNSLDPENPYFDCRQGSVFSRLSFAPKVLKEKKDHFYNNVDKLDTSVDEVMAMLQHNHRHWGKHRGKPVAKASNPTESFKRKQQAMLNCKASTDLSELTSMKMDGEGNSEVDKNKSENADGVPFLDFRRRNIPRKNLCDGKSGGCSRGTQEEDPSIGRQKRRKLVRPDLSKNEACNNRDINDSFKVGKVSQVQGSLNHILTRTVKDSMCHDNENKVSPVAQLPNVMCQTCTVDEKIDGQRKQVAHSQASLGRCVEDKGASTEQHKRRRLVRPNFDRSKDPQEMEMDDAAKIESTPMAKCSVSENNIGRIMVSTDSVKEDASQDGKFSNFLCPDLKDAIVDSKKQLVVNCGACIVISDGERNVLPENGRAHNLPQSFSLSPSGDSHKPKEFFSVREQRTIAYPGCDNNAGHLTTLRSGEDVIKVNAEARHVDEDSKRTFVQDSPSCKSSHERNSGSDAGPGTDDQNLRACLSQD